MGTEFPSYTAGNGSHSNGESSPCPNGNSPDEAQDTRSSYALFIQRACSDALQRVKQNNMLTNSNWASPLAAAPSAISVMAICLKTAAEKQAAGLEVEDVKVKNEKGEEVGTLPSIFFHTNLQYCNDVGRLAFLDAQKRMNSLRSTAHAMTDEEGSIVYIVELLEDPEDARYNLKPVIDQVRNTTSDCLANAKAITDRFEYWHLVIRHLKQTSLTSRGITIKKKGKTQLQKLDAKVREENQKAEKAAAEARIEWMQGQLHAARRDVAQAQADLNTISHLPPIWDKSTWEDIKPADNGISTIKASKKRKVASTERGHYNDGGTTLFGNSNNYMREEDNLEKTRYEKLDRERNSNISHAKEERELQQQQATYRLRAAYQQERQLASEVNIAVEKLSVSTYRLSEAKANLNKTAADLQRLGNEELELTNIMKILDESTHQLGRLKEQMEPLVLFFHTILVEIDRIIENDLEAFLWPIINGIKEGETSDEVEAVRLGKSSKKRILSIALQVQGCFSAIADISTAYVQISDRYIRPAINRMESLSTVSNSEWHEQSHEFILWCANAVQEIDDVARTTSKNMETNMSRQISTLQKCAIEAAADNS